MRPFVSQPTPNHEDRRGESIDIEDLRFSVLRADSRRLHTLQVERLTPAAPE